MGRKREPNIAARFKARYGATLRKRWNKVMIKKSTVYICPSCMRRSLIRVSVGIWRCRKCGHTVAGGAYQPSYLQEVLRKGR